MLILILKLIEIVILILIVIVILMFLFLLYKRYVEICKHDFGARSSSIARRVGHLAAGAYHIFPTLRFPHLATQSCDSAPLFAKITAPRTNCARRSWRININGNGNVNLNVNVNINIKINRNCNIVINSNSNINVLFLIVPEVR